MQKARLQKQRLPIAFLLLSFSYPVFSVSLFLSHIWPKSLLRSSHLNNNNKNGFHNTFFFVNICSLICFTQAPTLLEFPAFLAALLAVPVGPRSCGGRKRGEKERGKKNASQLQEGTTVPQFLQPPPAPAPTMLLRTNVCLVKTALLIISLQGPLVFLTIFGSSGYSQSSFQSI